MRTDGMSQIGMFTPDNLIAGNRHPVDIRHVVIKAGQKLERGTLLEEDIAEPGKYVIRGTGAMAADDPVEGEENQAADSGTEEGYKITDSDRKTLRNAGIFLTTIMM